MFCQALLDITNGPWCVVAQVCSCSCMSMCKIFFINIFLMLSVLVQTLFTKQWLFHTNFSDLIYYENYSLRGHSREMDIQARFFAHLPIHFAQKGQSTRKCFLRQNIRGWVKLPLVAFIWTAFSVLFTGGESGFPNMTTAPSLVKSS